MPVYKFIAQFAAVVALSIGAFVTESLVTSQTASADTFQCVVGALRANGRGRLVPGTRAITEAHWAYGAPGRVQVRRQNQACERAFFECKIFLDQARFQGRAGPYARCEILDTALVRSGPPIHERRRFDDGGLHVPQAGGFIPNYGGQGPAGHCNIQACSNRYRSFRVHDCSFQPYHGPRRQCTL